MEDVDHGVLPAVACLARSQDPEAAALGLSVFKALLTSLPDLAPKMVESVDGIDILEHHQLGYEKTLKY